MVDIHFWFRCELTWSKRDSKLFACTNFCGCDVSCCWALLKIQTSCWRQTTAWITASCLQLYRITCTGWVKSSASEPANLYLSRLKLWRENHLCYTGFPHLKRSPGWVQGLEGSFSLWIEPLAFVLYSCQKRESWITNFFTDISERRKKIWGIWFRLVFNSQQISQAGKAPWQHDQG